MSGGGIQAYRAQGIVTDGIISCDANAACKAIGTRRRSGIRYLLQLACFLRYHLQQPAWRDHLVLTAELLYHLFEIGGRHFKGKNVDIQKS